MTVIPALNIPCATWQKLRITGSRGEIKHGEPILLLQNFNVLTVNWTKFKKTSIVHPCCETGSRIYRLKTRKSKRLQMSFERRHFLIRHLNILSVGPARV